MPVYDVFSSYCATAENKDNLRCMVCKGIFQQEKFYFLIDRKHFEELQNNFFTDDFSVSMFEEKNAYRFTEISTGKCLTIEEISILEECVRGEDGFTYDINPDTLQKTLLEFQAFLINLFD